MSETSTAEFRSKTYLVNFVCEVIDFVVMAILMSKEGVCEC